MTAAERKSVLVDGLVTGYLEAGQGDPVVLLHGGEFGVSAELGWEHNIAALAENYRVLALDMLGFGQSAKVIDFNDGRGMRIRHVARFCDALAVASAHFVGNSMGAINLFVDATSEAPLLPVRSLAMICGGGEIQRNEHSAALYDYDAIDRGHAPHRHRAVPRPGVPGRRRLRAATLRVEHRPRRVGGVGRGPVPPAGRLTPPPLPSSKRAYERITVPTLVVEGAGDKLLPPGWAAEIAGQIAARPLGRDRTRRALPADRTARRRQRAAAGVPR